MNDPRRVIVRYASAVVLCGLAASVSAEHVERVKDIRVGVASGNPTALTEMNGALFFGADDTGFGAHLWKSDGTGAGTAIVGFIAGPSGRGPISEIVRAGNFLYLVSTAANDSLLVRSDGTPAGMSYVAGFCFPACARPSQLTNVNGVVYFTVSSPETGLELYRTNAPASPVSLVADVNAGPGGSSPQGLVAFQGQLYFSATAGGPERTLFKTDGTASGTTAVVNGGPGAQPFDPASLTVAGSRLYFTARGSDGVRRLWVTDGTAAGTSIAGGAPAVNPEQLRAVGPDLYFAADAGLAGGVELYRRDFIGVQRLTDIAPGAASASPRDLVDVNGVAYFSADDGASGRELWRYDPVAGAAFRVADLAPGPASSNPRGMVSVNGTLFFTADGAAGAELWRSDGTGAGTQLVADIASGGASSDPARLTPVAMAAGTSVFFTATTPADGNELRIMRNANPIADAGFDVTIALGNVATLDASGSTDPEGDVLSYRWRNPAGQTIGTSPTVAVAPQATTVYTVTTRDGFGGIASDTVTVTVDDRPPVHLTVVVAAGAGASGTVSIDPPSALCVGPAPCVYEYSPDTSVTLAAVAGANSFFTGWSSGPCSGTGPCTVVLDQDASVTASFAPTLVLSVEVQSAANGSGGVNIDPPNMNCANAPGTSQLCASSYANGTVVLLTATPSANSIFLGWTAGACTGNTPTCTVTMDQAKAVQATFRGPVMLSVDVRSVENGSGAVRIDPPNVDCVVAPGSAQLCDNLYRIGSVVQLNATPSANSIFLGWTAGACTGNSPTCAVTMDQAKVVQATFRGPVMLSVDVRSVENGSGAVHIDPPNVDCVVAPGSGQLCDNLYRIGSVVQLNATPSANSIFLGWTAGACTGNSPTCTVTMDQAKVVQATFRGPVMLFVDVRSVENGSGAVHIDPPNTDCVVVPGSAQLCENLYRIGAVVQLNATPSANSIFLGWTAGACTGNSPTCAVTMDQAKVVQATFRGPVLLSVEVQSVQDGSGAVHIDPPNVDCVVVPGAAQLCENLYRIGAVVQLNATPSANSLFVGWTAGACTGSSPTCTVTMDQSQAVQAAFRANHPPVAAPGGPYAALRNTAIAFDGSGSTDPDGDPLTHAWTFGDGASATGPNPTHAYTALGSYTVTLTVGDGYTTESASTTVTISNAVPVAVLTGGPASGVRGQVFAFDGSGSTDADGDALTYAWTFGDGSSAAGPTASHAYSSIGTFTVTLVVSDGTDSSAPQTTTVTIANRAPVANAGGPYSGTRGTPIAFSGSGTDADGDPLTYRWDFGDGATGTGVAPSHTYTAFGTFVVSLVVNDGFEDSMTAVTQATVPDRRPIASAGGPYTGVRGVAVTFNGSGSSDPDGNALTYQWSFGDGATGTGVAPTHVYTTLGTFTATLVVSDGGAESSLPSTATVTISNRAPVANAGGPYSGTRGTPIAFSGSGTDADGDPLTYRWDFGDGAIGTGAAPSHTYSTFGTFVVTLVVNDGHADSPASLTQATVPDRRPIANAGGPYAGVRGVAVTFNGSGSSDPDGNALTYQWSFGDGATGTGVAPTHVYTTLGTFTATLVVSDGGAQASLPSTATVTITNVAPLANAGADRTVTRKAAVTLDGRGSSDPDGTIAAWAWRQLSGPAVTLTAANTSQPRFTAPNVTVTTLMDFELTVTDDDGATAIDTVRITVVK